MEVVPPVLHAACLRAWEPTVLKCDAEHAFSIWCYLQTPV